VYGIQKAKERGCKWLHFGGGTTGDDNDSLLKFKRDFSKTLGEFWIGKRVHNEVVFNEIVQQWQTLHPESYEAARKLLELSGCSLRDEEAIKAYEKKVKDKAALAAQIGIGEPTLKDIFSELEKPGRDPREDMPKPILRSDVLDMKDLKPGMKLKGTVRNVIDFGAFVYIGVHQDGLVHISQMSDRYIKHPLEVVSVGDVVDVEVLSVDLERKKISLTLRVRD
jgi:uncharacterized protein